MAKAPTITTATEPVKELALSGGGGIEGAERTSRELLRWNPAIIGPDQQISPIKDMADARGRDMLQNDGYALGANYTHRDSIVGGEYRLNAQPDFLALGADEAWADEFQEIVESRFNLVANSTKNWLDAAGSTNFTGQIRLGVGCFMMTGEVLATSEWMRSDVRRPCKTAIQMIAPARLSNPSGEADTFYRRRGVQRDRFGKPLGYHIRSRFPSMGYFDGPDPYVWNYVPAAKPWGRQMVIHIVEALQPDQTRGISDMVSVLKNMRMTQKFQDVVLQNAVVNATYAACIESELPRELVFGAMGAGNGPAGLNEAIEQYMAGLSAFLEGSTNIKLDGVKMPHLYPGTKLSMKPAGTPGGVGTDFEQSLLRHTAAALGLSYEQFSRDYTKTNYSSARASMAETWKYMSSRKKMVADRLANSIYMLWLEEELNNGHVPLPPGMSVADLYRDPLKLEALCACDWIGASRGQIDELKETQAAVMRIKSGLSTYEAENSRLGQDWRRVFRQRAREQKLIKEYDLQFDTAATKPGVNDAQNTMRNEGEEQ
ncbi:Phage portal protein, lambda family [compost metagenome]